MTNEFNEINSKAETQNKNIETFYHAFNWRKLKNRVWIKSSGNKWTSIG